MRRCVTEGWLEKVAPRWRFRWRKLLVEPEGDRQSFLARFLLSGIRKRALGRGGLVVVKAATTNMANQKRHILVLYVLYSYVLYTRCVRVC